MENYKQVIKQAELALNNGEYENCINLLNPILEYFPVLTREGSDLRMILITALTAVNKKEEAIKVCKQLLKSEYHQVREEARSLLAILNSPNLNIPENWNIKFENKIENDVFTNDTKTNKSPSKPIKYINITNTPTGETKSFQKGFIIFSSILCLLMITLLSGCVRIDSTLDLRETNAVNFDFKIHNKYIKKFPWQINFENNLKNLSNKEVISIDNDNFYLKESKVDLKKANILINKIIEVTSDSINIDLKEANIDLFEKNYFIGKKYLIDVNLDLISLPKIEDLEIYLNIITPSKVKISKESNKVEAIYKEIKWELNPGEINEIEFSFWEWDKFFIGFISVIFIIIITYYIRSKKYELGSDLPQLPS